MDIMDIAKTVMSLLIGGGLLTFIQFLITRHDNRHDKFKTVLDAIKAVKSEVDGIKKELSEIRDDADRRDALQARTHILRFRDELQNDMTHTSEYFDQILEESQHYEQYCEKNPDFPNGRTEAAIKYITEEHQRLLKEHKLS